MSQKKKVGIFAGGVSPEHEVSLISGKNVFDAIDRDKIEPTVVGIDKDGNWVTYQDDDFVNNVDDVNKVHLKKSGKKVRLVTDINKTGLADLETGDRIQDLDAAFLVLHGNYGEDGKIQGYFEMMNLPYVGPDVRGSAIGMDKIVAKQVLQANDIPVAKYLWYMKGRDPKIPYAEAEAILGKTLFIKPANAGSSIGINKVFDERGYNKAVEEAGLYDNKILIEEHVPGREIECSVLGNEDVRASELGEVRPNDEFYSYNAKYVDEDGAALIIPAKVKGYTRDKIQEEAVKAFKALNLEGMARVDFLLREDGTPVLNEANTLPGFTNISMYPKLWGESGLEYSDLITELVDLAISRYERNAALRTEK
ncbi:D-alanine--D-alanine ligase family protein [Patescibacteria group bacterium]